MKQILFLILLSISFPIYAKEINKVLFKTGKYQITCLNSVCRSIGVVDKKKNMTIALKDEINEPLFKLTASEKDNGIRFYKASTEDFAKKRYLRIGYSITGFVDTDKGEEQHVLEKCAVIDLQTAQVKQVGGARDEICYIDEFLNEADFTISESEPISKSINTGYYKAPECDVGILLSKNDNKFSYQLLYNNKKFQGAVNLGDDGLLFNDLYSTFYGDNNYGEKAYLVGGLVENDRSFVIQNYGNAMNPYMVFDDCTKYLEYSLKATSSGSIHKKSYLFEGVTNNKNTKMYLIKGDKVTLLDEQTDDSGQKWYFINYKGKKDLNMWIKAEAVDIPDSDIEESIKEIPSSSIQQDSPETSDLSISNKIKNSDIDEAKTILPLDNSTVSKISELSVSEQQQSAGGSLSLLTPLSIFGLLAFKLS